MRYRLHYKMTTYIIPKEALHGGSYEACVPMSQTVQKEKFSIDNWTDFEAQNDEEAKEKAKRILEEIKKQREPEWEISFIKLESIITVEKTIKTEETVATWWEI